MRPEGWGDRRAAVVAADSAMMPDPIWAVYGRAPTVVRAAAVVPPGTEVACELEPYELADMALESRDEDGDGLPFEDWEDVEPLWTCC